MTWIKLEEAIRLDMRAKLAVITKQDFVNLTERPVGDFIAIVRRDTRIEDTEEIVREVLVKMYPEAEHWTITQIGFSLSRQALEVVVEHPSFAKVHPAYELPRLPNYGFAETVFAGDEIFPHVVAIESAASGEFVEVDIVNADHVISVGDGRLGFVPEEPAAIPPEAFGWRSSVDRYPSGFAFGETVYLIAGKRKYNTLIDIPVGSWMTVIEPPNREGWPDDAVQVQFKAGCGAVDAALLRRLGE